MKKLILTAMLLLLTLFSNAFPCDPNGAVYYISEEDESYLTYLRFENNYYLASVDYILGELRLNQIQRILWSHVGVDKIQGDSVQGEDLILRPLTHTNTFTYPLNSEIKFFRKIKAWIPCGADVESDPNSPDDGGTGDWRDEFWRVGKGSILDNTEWVMQLIDAQTGNILAVLDSVGIAPNPNSRLAQRYGFENTQMSHVRALPDDFAGNEVFIRISPRRTGLTPYGMRLNKFQEWISLSSLYEYEPGKERCSEQNFDIIFDNYKVKAVQYIDSMIIANGVYPSILIINNDPEFDNFLKIRYAYSWVGKDGSVVWSPTDSINSTMQQNGKVKLEFNDKSNLSAKLIKVLPKIELLKLTPHPSKETTTLNLRNDYQECNAALFIYNLNGELVSQVWKGQLSKGEQSLQFNVASFSSGIYILKLQTENDIAAAKKILIK